jgi:hypothetical protein
VADPAQALELGQLALEHYDHGLWEQAYSAFESAERLAHSPVFVLYMARCRRQTGRLLDARALYQRVAREPLSADAPAPWQRAVVSAKVELGALLLRIPSFCVQRNTNSTITRVELDGQRIDVDSRCREIELDPGEHKVAFWDRAGGKSSSSVKVTEGHRRIPLPPSRLEISRAAAARHAPPRSVTAPNHQSTSDSRKRKTIGLAAIGVGSLGLGVGAVAGLVAMKKASELECSAGRCPREEEPNVQDASRWAMVSTIGFIVGTVATTTGVVVLISAPSSASTGANLAVSHTF